MPAGFIPDEALAAQLSESLGAVPPSVVPWSLMLFVNDLDPTPGVTLADLQEASFGGYSRFSLDRDLWTEPAVTTRCAHSTWGTDLTGWTPTSGPLETVYGYAYVDSTTGLLRFIQRLDSVDILPVVVGVPVLILPTMTLTSAECP